MWTLSFLCVLWFLVSNLILRIFLKNALASDFCMNFNIIHYSVKLSSLNYDLLPLSLLLPLSVTVRGGEIVIFCLWMSPAEYTVLEDYIMFPDKDNLCCFDSYTLINFLHEGWWQCENTYANISWNNPDHFECKIFTTQCPLSKKSSVVDFPEPKVQLPSSLF